jgi:hypothetical protein
MNKYGHIDPSKYKCEGAKKGCKCTGCKDCENNAEHERATQHPSAYEE